MHGINGTPIVNMDEYVDHKGFTELVNEINEGIVRSEWKVGSFGPGVYDKDPERDLYWLEATTYLPRPPFKPGPDAAEVIAATKGMTLNQCRLYLKLRYGLYNSGSSVYLREPIAHAYDALNDPLRTKWTGNEKHFPKLLEWIKILPMKDIGRILFFVNEHNCPVVEHSDMHSSRLRKGYVANHKHSHEFIWIKPGIANSKVFYVLDEATGTRHYVPGNSAWFNSFDIHGADAGPTMTWSLRIDGHFTDELRAKLNA